VSQLLVADEIVVVDLITRVDGVDSLLQLLYIETITTVLCHYMLLNTFKKSNETLLPVMEEDESVRSSFGSNCSLGEDVFGFTIS